MRVQSLFDLSGKAALVVGGGAVPHAIAALFRDAGAAVTHAQEPALDEASVAALFASVPELDILVNGAIRPGAWTLETLAMDEWDRVHAVNLRGAFLLMREAVRTMRAHARAHLREQGGGGTADAGCRAGDDRGLAGEAEGGQRVRVGHGNSCWHRRDGGWDGGRPGWRTGFPGGNIRGRPRLTPPGSRHRRR